MLLNRSRKIAVSGLLLAVNQLFIVLASFIDVSSLTMLAVAAMVIGVAIFELDLKNGCIFFAASCLLGIILSPMKLYMISYGMMGAYVLVKECMDRWFYKRWNRWVLLGSKLVLFNVYFIPLLVLLPDVLLAPGEFEKMGIWIWLMVQVIVVLADYLYDRILLLYYQRIRKNIQRNGGGY